MSARRILLADNVVRGAFLGAVQLAWLACVLLLARRSRRAWPNK
jgi:hypothetical protein